MSVRGLRIHVAGSASYDADKQLLKTAHTFVEDLVRDLYRSGAGLIVSCGDEPTSLAGLPTIFDWTALETLAGLPDTGDQWPRNKSDRFIISASQHALAKIPASRSGTWTNCTRRSDFDIKTIPPGWKFGGALRTQQVRLGDVLVTLGGGSGVEHLAELYRNDGRSVIPIGGDLGSTTQDGRGGSSYLREQALHDTSSFFQLRDGTGGAASRLSSLLIDPTTDGQLLATNVASLLNDLRPPLAFYVRLLDSDSDYFPLMERFFRQTVDPVVEETGLTPHEVGRNDPIAAFLNVEVFEGIHRAGAVVVDLTGVRPNCMMELGYALGRNRRTVISAMKHTNLPFDQDKLPTYFWEEIGTIDNRITDYRSWFNRYLETPPLIHI